MRSTGYHFQILCGDGEIRYDSVKHRVNRYSTEEEAKRTAERRLPALKLIDFHSGRFKGNYTIKVYES
jgi:hypothetical protein